jgi:type I protein arginine methyltransferase
MRVDLNEIGALEEIPREFSVTRTVARSGSLHGFCLYFRVVFDAETSFDTSPARAPTHWANRLFRIERRAVGAGERLAYRVALKDLVNADTWEVTPD